MLVDHLKRAAIDRADAEGRVRVKHLPHLVTFHLLAVPTKRVGV